MSNQIFVKDATSVDNQFLNISHDRLEASSFLTMQPVHCQRIEENRYKPIKKLLDEKTLPTHLEVAIVLPNFQDDYYGYKEPYVINGNTRKYIWTKYVDLMPKTLLYVTVYHPNSRADIESIYRSIDSSNSVENSAQLIGGLCRSINYMPQSKKIKSGNFGVALRHAYACATGNSRIYGNEISVSDIRGKIEFNYFLNEIKFLDEVILGYQNDTAKNKKYSTGTIMSSIMLIAKKYGTDNPKVHDMVESLINEKILTHSGTSGLNDGLSVINIDLYQKYNLPGGRLWTLQSEGFGPIMIGNFLFCMDCFMNDILIPINRKDSKKGIVMKDEKAIAYYRNYFAK